MEKSFYAFRLHFSAPLHLAKGKTEYYDDSEDVLHSDTLMSALYACARLISAEEPGTAFFDRYRISSAFPFYEDEFFFPRPMLRLPEVSANFSSSKRNKLLKNIRFLGKSAFEQLICSQLAEILPGNFADHSQQFYSLAGHLKQKDQLINSEIQQRVSIPHNRAEDPVPYYVERLRFTSGAGLFFLAETTEEHLPLLRSALRLLGDNGIGTDKSVGNGQFTFDEQLLKLSLPELPAQHVCNLSLYCPVRDELNETFMANSAYQIIRRGGYLASPADPNNMTLRKKSVYFFSEGSVFSASTLQGKLLDLKPETDLVQHPVWREGRPLYIPVIARS